MTQTITWTKSNGGVVASKDGDWLLTGQTYYGVIKSWWVDHVPSGKRCGFRETLWEAKLLAEAQKKLEN
jgi:hypothetical protein